MADVACGTQRTVIAAHQLDLVLTASGEGIAAVDRAGIVVVAVFFRGGETLVVRSARGTFSTRVSIVASRAVWEVERHTAFTVHATYNGGAGNFVANHKSRTHAFAGLAAVASRAFIAVGT